MNSVSSKAKDGSVGKIINVKYISSFLFFKQIEILKMYNFHYHTPIVRVGIPATYITVTIYSCFNKYLSVARTILQLEGLRTYTIEQ